MTKKQLAKHDAIEARKKGPRLPKAAREPEAALVAIPKTGLVSTQLPTNAKQIAKLQALAETERAMYDQLCLSPLETPADIAFVDGLLTMVVQREDAAKAMRTSATGPLYGVIRTVESWFKPYLEELLYAKTVCKKLIGDARVAQAELTSGARTIAHEAAKVGDAATVVGALNLASEAAAPDGAAAKTKLAWAVKSVDKHTLPETFTTPGGLTLELWAPDLLGINAIANLYDGEGPAPVLPGVVFERVAAVGASHK